MFLLQKKNPLSLFKQTCIQHRQTCMKLKKFLSNLYKTDENSIKLVRKITKCSGLKWKTCNQFHLAHKNLEESKKNVENRSERRSSQLLVFTLNRMGSKFVELFAMWQAFSFVYFFSPPGVPSGLFMRHKFRSRELLSALLPSYFVLICLIKHFPTFHCEAN